MAHRKKNRGHRTSKIVKYTQSHSNGQFPYYCSLYYLARCMTWRENFMRSKDAQKQLARTSLFNKKKFKYLQIDKVDSLLSRMVTLRFSTGVS